MKTAQDESVSVGFKKIVFQADKMPKKFRELSVRERGDFIANTYGLSEEKASILKNHNTLTEEALERIGENPISNFEYPLRFSDRISINGMKYHIPIITEEASVVAGLSYAGKVCGNIEAKVLDSYCIGKISFIEVEDPDKLIEHIKISEDAAIERINKKHSHAKTYRIETVKRKTAFGNSVVANIYFDSKNAMGAAVAAKMGDELADIISSEYQDKFFCLPGVISNNSGRVTIAKTKIPEERLKRDEFCGKEVKRRICILSELSEVDEEAATRNKGIMNGVEGVAYALAQDTRAINAANDNRKPWSKWHCDDEYLYGELKMTIPCGTIGGEIEKYPKAKVLLEDVLKPKDANELAEIIAAVGLAQNFAAMSMNVTIGTAGGHNPFR